jgi:hypothetical protein
MDVTGEGAPVIPPAAAASDNCQGQACAHRSINHRCVNVLDWANPEAHTSRAPGHKYTRNMKYNSKQARCPCGSKAKGVWADTAANECEEC